MPSDAKDAREGEDAGVEREPVHGREWIGELLERAGFVDWDRFTVGTYPSGEQYVDVYGWIDREDEYKDFVWTRFRPDNEPERTMEYTTSSDEYTEELMRIWFGEKAVEEDHNPCRRVEHAFDIENAIELGEQATLVTDGGQEDAEVEHREKDIGVAALQEREAREALERGDYLDAIEAAGSIMSFAARAAERDAPVAVLMIDRIGDHRLQEIALAPGEEKRIEIDGKAKLILRGEKRYKEGSA